MKRFLAELRRDLTELEAQSLRRGLRPLPSTGRLIPLNGKPLINLAGNDYLAISQHPRLKQVAIEAVKSYGTGAGASRLVVGHLDLHAQVEQKFAAFKHAEAALLLPTGYMANLAVLTTLAGASIGSSSAIGDLICLDKLNHASLIDAARASGAKVRIYPHLENRKLECLLANHAAMCKAPPNRSKGEPPSQNSAPAAPGSTTSPPGASRRFIVTDSVFSMDGDVANLPELCDLAERHEAILVVDEAHATGVLGANGAGLCEQQNVTERVDIVISTASKALGGLGGIVTASQAVVEMLINHARPLIYTTAAPPAQAAVIGAALEVVRTEPWRRQRLLQLSERLCAELGGLGWPTMDRACPTPIVPLVVGSAESALNLAAHLESHGVLAMAIRPPSVPPGTARVRLSLRADLEDTDLDRLINALRTYHHT